MRSLLCIALPVLAVIGQLILARGSDVPPTVVTTPATNVGPTFATLNGTVNSNGLPTNARFEYGLTTAYSDSTPLTPVSIASAPVPITFNISGLLPSTPYHFRAKARNVDGTGYGLDQIFTTLAAVAPNPPLLLSPPNGATNQSLTTTLFWTASSGAAAYRLQVSSDSVFLGIVVDDSSITTTSRQIGSLTIRVQYFWRVAARNQYGSSVYSTVWRFTTRDSLPPIVATSPATNVTYNGATLNGTVNPNGMPTNARFEYGASIAYGDSTPLIPVSLASPPSPVLFNISGLLSNSTYHFRAKATNQEGTGYGLDQSFVTLIAPPPTPTLLSPLNGATSVSITPTLSWNPSPGAISYRLQVATDSSFVTLVADNSAITTTSSIVGPLNNLTRYFWRVRAQNSGGNSPYSTSRSFTTVISAPSSPSLFRPLNGAINVTINIWPEWILVPSAATYRLQVAFDSLFATIMLDDSTIVGPTRPIGPLLEFTTYFWRVRAQNVGGVSPYSSPWYFVTTGQMPSQVSLVAPADGATISLDTVKTIWRRSQPQVNRYWFELSFDSLFTFTSIDSTGTDTTKIVRQLVSNTTYWWRVRGYNPAGWGLFSVARRFRVVLTDVSPRDGMPRVFSVSQNYPNPFNPRTVIHYELPVMAEVKLNVYTLLGQEVAELVKTLQAPGEYDVYFYGEGLPSGVYLYRLQAQTRENGHTNGFTQTRKLLLLR